MIFLTKNPKFDYCKTFQLLSDVELKLAKIALILNLPDRKLDNVESKSANVTRIFVKYSFHEFFKFTFQN